MGMTIENVIPGMLYKTNNPGKAELFRNDLAKAINSDNIVFEMSGPMVNSILMVN